ncbi:MAG: hypothetical protein ABI408_08190, partial [Gemmatimonadaceae bacterium]
METLGDYTLGREDGVTQRVRDVAEKIKSLAPGQFGIVAVLLLGIAAYFAYLYTDFPRRQEEESRAVQDMYATSDTTNRLFVEAMIRTGKFNLPQAESARVAQLNRSEQGMFALAIRQLNSS